MPTCTGDHSQPGPTHAPYSSQHAHVVLQPEKQSHLYLHRNLQVRLSDREWMVVDLEQAAYAGSALPPGYKPGSWAACKLGTNAGGEPVYTVLNDMQQIGDLLHACMQRMGAVSADARQFVQALLRMELTATQALQTAWLAARSATVAGGETS